jgi:hypothetical protein
MRVSFFWSGRFAAEGFAETLKFYLAEVAVSLGRSSWLEVLPFQSPGDWSASLRKIGADARNISVEKCPVRIRTVAEAR